MIGGVTPIGGRFKIYIHGHDLLIAAFKRSEVNSEEITQIARAFVRRSDAKRAALQVDRNPMVIVVTETGEL